MTKIIAPYGTWRSPVTVELMTEAAIGLSALAVDGTDLYWLESRPSEKGRATICRRSADGAITDMTPAPIYVGSRVHEYGGGAYAVRDGVIVYSERSDGGVFVIAPGAAPRRIATPEQTRHADFEFDLPRRRILAVREDHRDRPPTDPKASIIALSLDDGTETTLVEGPDFLAAPRISPDGAELAWIAWDHPDMPWDATRLYTAPLDASGGIGVATLVAGQERESVVQPRWAADGTLVFSSDRSDWWNVYARRGDAVEPIHPLEAEIGGPAWVFAQRSYHLLPDGRILAAVVENGMRSAVVIDKSKIERLDLGQVFDCPLPLGDGLAFIATPPTEPPSIALASWSGGWTGSARETVRSAAPNILPPETIAIGMPITFATRGMTGHAFWYPPTNRDFAAPEGELPPLVVFSHGGPTSMTTNGFGLGVQWWTSRGFSVVDVNYGGSTGYGRAYRRMLDAQWGIVDVEDCIAAAQALADRGHVDRNCLVIRGGSAGGFTTLAALTSSDLFKAGASLYGVADLMLLARDTHKFESRYLDRLVGPLPDSAALYHDRSPIHHIDRLSCPIIFFQGLEDKTVPPNQAETMVDAMAARGLPVAYYAFEGEGHGFRQAETLKRVLELELDFYGRVFGFIVPDLSERAEIRNMPR